MIYHVVIRIIVHLNDLLCNYLIYYAIKIIRKRERVKEKRTIGTGWEIQPVP